MDYKLYLAASLIFCALFGAAKAQTNLGALGGDAITGAWRINSAESDDAFAKMQTLLQKKAMRAAQGKAAPDDTLPSLSVSLIAPETLILAGDDEKSMTVNEGYQEIVFTRTFATDGKTRSGETPNGAGFLLAASQNQKSLKIETVSPRGNKMIETFAAANEGKRLIVTVRFEAPDKSEILTLRRVYDRAILDFPQTAGDEIQ